MAQARTQKRTLVNSVANRAMHRPAPTQALLEALEDSVKENRLQHVERGEGRWGLRPGWGASDAVSELTLRGELFNQFRRRPLCLARISFMKIRPQGAQR